MAVQKGDVLSVYFTPTDCAPDEFHKTVTVLSVDVPPAVIEPQSVSVTEKSAPTLF